MRLFNKTIDRQLFKQYSLGSDLSKQEVVAKIFNPFGRGNWFILNSDPEDPDYLWAIVDLGYGAEVGSVSRSELETYRGRFGMGFERDLSFNPINAEELYKGLRQGKYYAEGGGVEKNITGLNSLGEKVKDVKGLFYWKSNEDGKIRITSGNGSVYFLEFDTLPEAEAYVKKVNARTPNFFSSTYENGGQIEVVYERRADFKKKPIKLLLLNKGKEQKGFTFSGKDQVAVLDNYNRNKQEDLEKLWNLKGYETKYTDGGSLGNYGIVIDGDWDEPKKFKTFSLAKKWIYENAKNYESLELVDPYGDTIFVEGNSTKEDLDWLFSNDEVSAFAKGGNIADFSDNQRMIMNQNVELEHHHEELEDILEDKIEIPAWVVAKMATATQSVSDVTHYLDGQKELMEDEDEDDGENEEENEEQNEDQEEIKNKEVVEPINVSAGTKAELTKKFTDDALGNLRGFLKGMEGIELRDDYTFDYKGEQFEIEPIINSDENGVSNAVFTIFDGDGEEVGDVSYSRDGGKQKFTANSEFFGWNNTKFEDGGFMNGVYADGGNIAIDNLNKNTDLREKMIDYIVSVKAYGKRMSDRQYDALEKRISDKSFVQLKKEYDTLKGNSSFADGGYFDGTIPKVSSYMSTYAKGGEIAKAEVFGLSKNIMGTTDIEMKISGMRKAQDFIVYPIGKDDAGNVITIQSDTRIGQINLVKGVGVMSQSHSSGAYFVHLQMDKLTSFTISESDLEDLKAHIFKTAGDNVGSRGIFSDNSGASGIYANGGNLQEIEISKSGELKTNGEVDESWYNVFAEYIVNKKGEEVGAKIHDINKGIIYYQALAKDTPENREGFGWEEHNDMDDYIFKKFKTIDDLEHFLSKKENQLKFADGGSLKRTRRTKDQMRKDEYNKEVDLYNWYVVNISEKRAESGFEYKEDALDLLSDYDGDKNFKVVSKRALKTLGIAIPNESWKYAKGGSFDDDFDGISYAKTKAKANIDWDKELREYAGEKEYLKLTRREKEEMISDLQRDWDRSNSYADGGLVDGFNLVFEKWSKMMGGNGVGGSIRTTPENYYVATIDNNGDILFEDLEANTRNINKNSVKKLWEQNRIKDVMPKKYYDSRDDYSYEGGGFMNNVYDNGGSLEDKLTKLEKKKSDLESRLFDAKLKANSVMNNIGFGAGMRRSKVNVSSTKEDSLKEQIEVVEKEISEIKKEMSWKNSKYILKADIKTVTVKRNGKEVTYKGADVLNGANVLSKGGDITSKANYIPKRDVVEVELKDGSKVKPVNGYWVKKGAEPIGAEPTSTSSGSLEPKISMTEIRKDARGNWRAETNIDNFDGYDWRISTVKTYSGNLVSSAQGGKTEATGTKGIVMFKYAPYEDPNHTLEVSKPKRLTDKVVTEQHDKALAKFKKFMETGMFKGGGKISNFDKLSAKVAKEYEGKPVKSQYQEEYGKYYSKEEAQEVGDKVAGKMKVMTADKKAFGGIFGKTHQIVSQKPQYPDLDGKQVALKSGNIVDVFSQSGNTLSVLELGKVGTGKRPHNIDISEVDMSSFETGGKTQSRKANSGTEMLKQANELAKKIRKDGESWLDAKKRAFAQLKK